MNSFRGRMILAGMFFVFLTGIGFLYAASNGPQMARDSARVVEEFYRRSQTHDFRGARALLTQNLQGELSEAQLAQQWDKYEARNGRIARWKGTGAGLLNFTGDKVNLWPRFVDYNHSVLGERGTSGQVALRIVPENDTWRIDRLSIQAFSWIGSPDQ